MNINHNLNLVVLVGRVVMAIIAIATLFERNEIDCHYAILPLDDRLHQNDKME